MYLDHQIFSGSWAGQGLFGLNIENMEKTNNMSLLYRNPEPQSIPAGFFDDAPWGRIPEDRRAILVGPAQFKGGLLGGKMSKLAALAKARKAAAEAKEQNGPVVLDPKRSISLLSRLGAKDAVEKVSSCSPEAPISPKPAPATVPHSPAPVIASPQVSLTPLPAPQEAGQEVKLKTPSIPPESPDQSKRKEPDVLSEPNVTDIFTPIRAIPSPFAVSMFGERMVPNGFPANERLPYFTGLPAGPIAVVNDAFAGPSPDDVVLAAQSRSKGAYDIIW